MSILIVSEKSGLYYILLYYIMHYIMHFHRLDSCLLGVMIVA